MRYCPISVRLTPLSPSHAPHAISGCFIDAGSSQYCVTVLHFPVSELSKYRIHVAAAHVGDDLVWIRARVLDSFRVLSENRPSESENGQFAAENGQFGSGNGYGAKIGQTSPQNGGNNAEKGKNGLNGNVPETHQKLIENKQNRLFPFLDNILRNGFNFFPMNSVSGSSLQDITVVRMSAYVQETIEDGLKPFQIGKVHPLSQLIVQSTPFGLTNPKLFANFRSSGAVCAVFADGCLSDCRYLENMIGGVVCSRETGLQVGLVLGNLRKTNGDGDLTVILALQVIPEIFPKIELKPRFSSVIPNSAKTPIKFSNLHRILPLLLSSKKGSSWGSCVVYNETTLVTNYHVMQPLLEDPTISCNAVFNGKHIKISADQVVVPFQELDLAFVVVCAGTFEHHHLPTLGTSYTIKASDVGSGLGSECLIAAGFGLFLTRGKKEPLLTRGYICRTLSMKPFQNHSQGSIPCLMITSTACWNGSSGGGIFDRHGGFVGLISSNAQVYMPEHGDQAPTQKTEKVPSFCFTIPADLIRVCYEEKVVGGMGVQLSHQVIKAWSLEVYYNERFQHEAKI